MEIDRLTVECADDPENSWTDFTWLDGLKEFTISTVDLENEACSIISTADAKRLADFIYKHIGENNA